MGIDMKKWLSANKESICIYPCSEDTPAADPSAAALLGYGQPLPLQGNRKSRFSAPICSRRKKRKQYKTHFKRKAFPSIIWPRNGPIWLPV